MNVYRRPYITHSLDSECCGEISISTQEITPSSTKLGSIVEVAIGWHSDEIICSPPCFSKSATSKCVRDGSLILRSDQVRRRVIVWVTRGGLVGLKDPPWQRELGRRASGEP